VLLDFLERQHIPLWSSERGERDPLVFGGGPVLTANPEPLAPFFDVLLLGDGELLLPAFIDAVQAHRGAPRAERLRALAAVPGVYVPALYAPATAATASCWASSRSAAASRPGWPSRPGEATPSATRW